jgi:hypothetical protein
MSEQQESEQSPSRESEKKVRYRLQPWADGSFAVTSEHEFEGR